MLGHLAYRVSQTVEHPQHGDPGAAPAGDRARPHQIVWLGVDGPLLPQDFQRPVGHRHPMILAGFLMEIGDVPHPRLQIDFLQRISMIGRVRTVVSTQTRPSAPAPSAARTIAMYAGTLNSPGCCGFALVILAGFATRSGSSPPHSNGFRLSGWIPPGSRVWRRSRGAPAHEPPGGFFGFQIGRNTRRARPSRYR